MCLFMVVRFVEGDGGICGEKIQLYGENSNENVCICEEVGARIKRNCVSVVKNATFH